MSRAAARASVAAALATGCYGPRIEAIEHDIELMTGEVDQLRGDLEKIRTTFDRHNEALNGEVVPDPEGFDGSKPLPPQGRRPDVILLTVDTLRADHLGTYGYSRDTSPFFDALAASGTRYADMWSPAPWTLPSHTTMLTGLYTRNHGAIEGHLSVPTDRTMLQEALGQSGYLTAGVVGTLYVSSRFGFERGFDYFEDFGIADTKMNNSSTVKAEQVFHHALHWAQQQEAGQPIFLFLHVYDVHYGYNPPPPWNEKFDRASVIGDALYKDYFFYKKHPLPPAQMEHQIAQYDEEIAYVDHSFREMVERWRAERPNVIVSVTADHGEEFGERGSWGHAHTLFPEQLRVPWIVAGPGVRSQIVTGRAGTEDIAPTLAALAGVDFPAGDGLDRSAEIRTGRPPAALPGHISAKYAETSRFETLRYRWHHPPYDYIADLNYEWYGLWNLESDPLARKNALSEQPDEGAGLAAELVAWLGDNWEATRPGTVFADAGAVITRAGKRADEAQIEVVAGDRFEVHPKDAGVSFKDTDSEAGPFHAVGGELPGEGAPLRYLGGHSVNPVVNLDDSERELLEALGYLNADEPDEPSGDEEGAADEEPTEAGPDEEVVEPTQEGEGGPARDTDAG